MGVLGDTPAVGFGGAPRFYAGAGFGRRGAVRGGVFRAGRRGFNDGGFVVGRRMLRSDDASDASSETSVGSSSSSSSSGCSTIWDILSARPDVSTFRDLVAREIPAVAATLDARDAGIATDTTNATDTATLLMPSLASPYGPEVARGLAPLLAPDGSPHRDTLFAPSDAAMASFREYARRAGVEDPEAIEAMLGAGDKRVAANLAAYHVVPDRVVRLAELLPGELLTTALGGDARLAFDRVGEEAEDDGYHDGGEGEGGGAAVLRGVGSQAGVVGGGQLACNGVVFVVDHVLLPADADGKLDDEQKARAEKIRDALERERDAEAEAEADPPRAPP